MSIKIGFVIDPIDQFNTKKDTTFAMMLEAERRGFEIYIMEQHDLILQQGQVLACMKKIKVFDREKNFYSELATLTEALLELDLLLMRKDPPFNINYIYTTHLLEIAEKQGLFVCNKPQSLRDANEKLFTGFFPECCPKTIVSAKQAVILDFLATEKDIVVKPLDSMGGASVFHLLESSNNKEHIISLLTEHETRPIMAQRFIAAIKNGDKRVLMIDGDPVPYALARIPAPHDFRGNLAQGAKGEGRPLTERDRWIANKVGPVLRQKGLLFVGLDIIGDYLTEINVTSPTCARELDRLFNINICKDFFDVLEEKMG